MINEDNLNKLLINTYNYNYNFKYNKIQNYNIINKFKISKIKISKINKISKIKNFKTFFGSPLKKFIYSIYEQFEIPKESFYLSLYYIRNFYKYNYYNFNLINNLFNNINYFVFSSIIIALKILYDIPLNIKFMCDVLKINYNNYINTEITLLKGLDWKTSYNTNDYLEFKKYLVHYMDLHQQMD